MFVLSYGTWTWTCPINVDLDLRTVDLDLGLTVAGLVTSLARKKVIGRIAHSLKVEEKHC